jgi:hypothetical protein
VALARVGTQSYAPWELQRTGMAFPDDRMVKVERTADEVFAAASIRSFQGKPVVDEHPADMVDADNISLHQIGTVFNVRRGTPPNDDVMITSPRGIALVCNGKRAVSVGYNANYDRTGPASARQTRIRANHIALVSEGRCGARCQIGDAAVRTRDDDTSWAVIQTSDPPDKVGGELVMRLPGPLSSYYLSVDEPTQEAALFRYPLPQQDPGLVVGFTGVEKSTMDRDRAYYTGLAGQANVARELAGLKLQAINAANRAAWKGR